MKEIALLTGVSRREGLGFETARQLIQEGFHVILTARDIQKAESLAAEIGAEAHALDITQEGSIDALFTKVQGTHGRLDVLVNNAGAFFDMGAQPLKAEMEFIKSALDVNLLGAWRMVKAFVPLLQQSDNGRIVNVSSGAGSFQDPVFGLSVHQAIVPVYGITKLALNGLTVKLHRQLKEMDIKINSVCPGFVATYPGTAEYGAIPVEEGAKGIVWAATLDKDGPSGGFFRDGKPIDW